MMKLKEKLQALLEGKKLTSTLWNKGCYITITSTNDLVFVYIDTTGYLYESVLKEPHFLELLHKADEVLNEN